MWKALRRIGLALFLSLLLGIALGVALRLRLERPTVYVGDAASRAQRGEALRRPSSAASASDADPLDVGDAGAVVGDTRHHEQQVG